MIHFSFEHVTDRILRINDETDVYEYLVIGNERALLIDTGYGIGNLREYVNSLTDKPYDVVCTHGHVDHANGAPLFDVVYIHPAEIEVYHRHSDIDFRASFLKNGFSKLDEEPCRTDYVPASTKQFRPLFHGDVFDLGGIHIEAIHVPGHTQGMMVLLDREDRIAFIGDACGIHTLLMFEESSTVAEYHQALNLLQRRSGEFSRVLRQHGSCESPVSIIANNCQLAELILKGTDDAQACNFFGKEGLWAKAVDNETDQRIDGGIGNIAYLPDRIR